MNWLIFISPICVMLASICNSVMDQREIWQKSKISKIGGNWWAVDEWLNKYVHRNPAFGKKKLPPAAYGYWHFFKFLMVFFIAEAIVWHVPIFKVWDRFFVNEILEMALLGLCWNMPFDLFYDKVLRLKQFR